MNPPDWSYTPATALTTDLIAAGATLVRVYVPHPKRSAIAFNPTAPVDGGRFDALPSDLYPYLYAGSTFEIALQERVFPLATIAPGRPLVLAESLVADRWFCYFTTKVDLQLVRLTDARDVMAIKGDLDIVRSTDYAATREWARYIRHLAPTAQGIAWHSRPGGGSEWTYVLFGDRIPKRNHSFQLLHKYPFAHGTGRDLLVAACARNRVVLDP